MQATPRKKTPGDAPKGISILNHWFDYFDRGSKQKKTEEIFIKEVSNKEYKPPLSGGILLQTFICLFFIVFVSRFWFLQIHKGSEYSLQAQKNYGRVELIPAIRGRILDAKGRILADNKRVYGISIIGDDVEDLPSTLAQISAWTSIPIEEVNGRYRRGRLRSKPFEPVLVASDLSQNLVGVIESEIYKWPGVKISVITNRTYPEGELFSHLLGYVSEANDEEIEQNPNLSLGDLVGKSGIELTLDERLRGKKGVCAIEVDAMGHILERTHQQEPIGGENLRLSIDIDLQRACWSALNGEVGSIIVMEPDTGKLRALVTTPSYDNNLFAAGISQKDWDELVHNPKFPLQNRAIQSTYPPGSVWKLVMAACFLENKISPNDYVFCGGSTKLGKQVFRCWNHSGHGSQNMLYSISNSCDVYYYITASKVGIDRIEKFAKASGFGSPTGIDLPHEKSGLVPSKEWKRRRFKKSWGKGDTFNASIGQGFVLTTPLQVATYVCGLLNGGKLFKPRLIEEEKPVIRGHIPASRQTLEYIVDCMRRTASSGTARVMRRGDADMGGKTGTAQVVKLKGHGQSRIWKERDHAWIATWGRKGEKSYVVVVMVEHGGGGSSTAGPIAKKIYNLLFGNVDYYANPNYYKEPIDSSTHSTELVGPPLPPQRIPLAKGRRERE